MRAEAWQLFLGLSVNDNKPPLNLEMIESHPEYHQVNMDVRRCLKRFPPGISYEQIGKLQKQLIAVILSVIAKHNDLKYYQVTITNFVFNIMENVVLLFFFFVTGLSRCRRYVSHRSRTRKSL